MKILNGFHEPALLLHLIWGKWYLAMQVTIWTRVDNSFYDKQVLLRLSLALLHVNSTGLYLISEDTVI